MYMFLYIYNKRKIFYLLGGDSLGEIILEDRF